MAASAALDGDPSTAVPRLRASLERLGDRDYALAVDPDDELKGSLLDDLWPSHVSTDEILPLLLARRRHRLTGAYWMFLWKFAAGLRGESLEAVLRWASSRVTEEPSEHPVYDNEDDETDTDEVPVGELDVVLVERLVEGALLTTDVANVADAVAALVWPRLERFDRPTMPEALDEGAVVETDPHYVTEKRRVVADALVRHGAGQRAFTRADAWHLIRDWQPRVRWSPQQDHDGMAPSRSQLLDPTDFEWCLRRAIELHERGEPIAAGAMAEVAAQLFDPSDVDAIEAAWRQQGTVNWERLVYWFEPIPLDSETAQSLRQMHELGRRAERDDSEPPPAAALLRQELRDMFDGVVGGNTAKFWQLAWNLQFPPGVAQGQRRLDDRLLDFPGIAMLGPDVTDRLVCASRDFLLLEHDHADEWLGTDSYDRRGLGGLPSARSARGAESARLDPSSKAFGLGRRRTVVPFRPGRYGRREPQEATPRLRGTSRPSPTRRNDSALGER